MKNIPSFQIQLSLVLLLCFTACPPLLADDRSNYGSITGQVIDGNTSKPLVGANVELAGASLGSATNEDGVFYIADVPAGSYTVRVQFLGYKTAESRVKISSHQTVRVNFEISSASLKGKQVVVTATRTERFQRDVPVMVNVADDFTFETSQSLNLSESLNFIPAVRVETNCQNCGFTQVRINGMEGPYSQILVNSRPIFSALNGVYGLDQIPAAMIERVEVVRGSGSALFGSAAIGGIINIITAEPVENSYDISLNQALIDGERSDRNISLNASLVNDDRNLGISLFGNLRNRDYYDANQDGFSEMTELRNNSFGMRSFYRPTPLSKISLEMHSIYEDRRGGNRFQHPPHEADIAEALTHNVFGGGLTYERLFSEQLDNQLSVYASFQSTQRDSYYGVGRNLNAYGNTEELIAVGGLQYSSAINSLIGKKHRVTVGLEGQVDDLRDFQPAYNRMLHQKVYRIGIFAQEEWEINHTYTLLMGFRLDNHSLIKPLIVNPRVSLLVNLTPLVQFRTAVATGYLAPQTFDEDLHLENVGGQTFNIIELADDLKPEHSFSISASVDLSRNDAPLPWGITLEGFYTRLRDVFIKEPIRNEGKVVVFEKQNGEGARIIGSTLETRLFATRNLELQAGVTVQSSLFDTPVAWTTGHSEARYLRTPDVHGYYLSNWEISHALDLSISGVYTGSMVVPHYAGYIAEDILQKTSPFLELNMKLTYTVELGGHNMPELRFNIGVYNLLSSYQSDFDRGIDRDSNYIYGPGRPRTFYTGIKIVY